MASLCGRISRRASPLGCCPRSALCPRERPVVLTAPPRAHVCVWSCWAAGTTCSCSGGRQRWSCVPCCVPAARASASSWPARCRRAVCLVPAPRWVGGAPGVFSAVSPMSTEAGYPVCLWPSGDPPVKGLLSPGASLPGCPSAWSLELCLGSGCRSFVSRVGHLCFLPRLLILQGAPVSRWSSCLRGPFTTLCSCVSGGVPALPQSCSIVLCRHLSLTVLFRSPFVWSQSP